MFIFLWFYWPVFTMIGLVNLIGLYVGITNYFWLFISGSAQQLFIRLFLRKHQWIVSSRIKYPKIASDLCPILQSLVHSGFLQDGTYISYTKILFLCNQDNNESVSMFQHSNGCYHLCTQYTIIVTTLINQLIFVLYSLECCSVLYNY